jgi:hypothetical protein
LVIGGAYVVQLVFGLVVPASCPRCGADSAVPKPGGNLALYVCRACGAELNAMQASVFGEAARAAAARPPPTPAQEEKTQSRWGAWFLIGGIAAIGVAVWLGEGSIRLVHGGVSTEARVLRVNHEEFRNSENQTETRHTAIVEYRVGEKPLTLQRSWSTGRGSFWSWPDYQPGERLKVIYLPGDPSRASIDTLPELFFAPLFLTLFGLVFSAIGAAMTFYRRRSDEAPDGTLVLSDETQPSEGPPGNFLKIAIALVVLLAGAGVLYYYAMVLPDVERQKIAAEAQERRASEERVRSAKLRSEKAAAAALAAASAPVPARPGMSECQLLLLNQRNQYAEKNGLYHAFFLNLRPPKDVDCKDCRAELTSKLQSWAGFDVASRGYSPSGFKPGCVAYRQDIYGSAEGAKCIAGFLGSGYSADQSCGVDGFPYTITHRLPREPS